MAILHKKIQALYSVDDGRFTKLLNGFTIKSVCMKCTYFIPSAKDSYRCADPAGCIGVTMSPGTKLYLLWKTGLVTETEYLQMRQEVWKIKDPLRKNIST